MEANEIAKLFENCTKNVFRLQTLPSYSVEEEKEEIERYLAGQSFPDSPDDFWIQTIKDKIEAGIQVSNLHVLPTHLSPYLRFAIDWSYLYRHDAGEQILFIPLNEAKSLGLHSI